MSDRNLEGGSYSMLHSINKSAYLEWPSNNVPEHYTLGSEWPCSDREVIKDENRNIHKSSEERWIQCKILYLPEHRYCIIFPVPCLHISTNQKEITK